MSAVVERPWRPSGFSPMATPAACWHRALDLPALAQRSDGRRATSWTGVGLSECSADAGTRVSVKKKAETPFAAVPAIGEQRRPIL